jgi:hypothetical protein
VTAGNIYYINVGPGGANSLSTNDATVAGNDSWFNSVNTVSTTILAKGGSGGQSAVGNSGTTAYGTGGQGTTSGSRGDLLYAGGSGSAGASGAAGGGGSGAGKDIAGTNATTNTGAIAPSGGGNGGTGPSTGSVSGGNGFNPGGGGAGSRDSSGLTVAGGTGGAGQVVITVKQLAATSLTPAESWRQHYFNTTGNTGTAADTGDPDGDGLNNAREYILGTVPTAPDRGSFLNMAHSAGGITLTFTALQTTGTGYAARTRYYAIETTTDLTNSSSWTPLAGYSEILGANHTVSAILPVSGNHSFYRLKVRLE